MFDQFVNKIWTAGWGRKRSNVLQFDNNNVLMCYQFSKFIRMGKVRNFDNFTKSLKVFYSDQ